MTGPGRLRRDSLTNLIEQVDALPAGQIPPDTVPSGYPSLDRVLGGGFRLQDLIVLGGDVGAGKSALVLGIAIRAAAAGHAVSYFSGEMDEDRLLERALALEGRVQIDEIRTADLTDSTRAALGGAAVRLRDLPVSFHPLGGRTFEEALAPAFEDTTPLVVIDYLQLLPPPDSRLTHEEDCAASVRVLKNLALSRSIACLLVAQLPLLGSERPDHRPTLDDFGALGSVKQHGDLVLGIYREDMYASGPDVEGATELIVAKNRNGPTGFIDLYFHRQWMRFEDMLDPDR
jgi:replicative DNA helicase